MADAPKMKIPIGADTSDFDKGARKVKQEMRDLSKVSSDAFADIGSAIGIDTRKIQQFASAISGLGQRFTQLGSAATSSFSSIARSLGTVATGIAGLGLAAAISAFKQLNDEADAFEQTIQGGVIAKQTEAYLATFRQSLRDQRGFGEDASEARRSWRESWARFLAGMNPMNNLETLQKAENAAQRAKEIATELYDIELQQKNNSIAIAKLDAEIAQKREIISDYSRDTQERAEALAAAQDLIKEKLNLQLPLAERQRDLLEEYNKLASTSIKDYDAEIAAKIRVNNLTQQEAAEQRSLLRLQNQINAALQKGNDIKSQRRPGIEGVNSGAAIGNALQVPVLPIVQLEKITELKNHIVTELGGGITLAIAIDPDSIEEVMDITDEVKNIVQETALSLGQSIGTLLGDLISGEDAWGSFANAAISAFGDLAIAIGKIAIEAGLAASGISAMLKNPGNWYLAVAAGTLLVALGYAVKSGLANVASGNYSASSNVASSGTYSSSMNNYEQREVYVNVTGTLRADGNQLVAVLNNTNKKNQVTT